MNPLWPSALLVDEVSYPLDDVLADVALHHGRTGVFDDPIADTLQITMRGVEHELVRALQTGVPLQLLVRDEVTAAESPRFTGRVTDAALDVDELTVIGAGRLSTLAAYPVGLGAWPAEAWSARVTRIFAEAGLAALLELHRDPQFDPQLAARDPATAGPTTLGDYLNFLAPMVGCAVADRMNGTILVQAIGSRALAGVVELDPNLVLYAPIWHQVLPEGNVVTVRYTGDQSESVTVRDNASVALYGERPVTIDTSFVQLADADRRARTRLARSAFPHWNVPEAPVLAGLPLAVGAPLELSSFPPAAPYDPWTPIVEGWTDAIAGDAWTMTVALSDPLASGLTLPWAAVPVDPAYHWNTINPDTSWAEALTLDELRAR